MLKNSKVVLFLSPEKVGQAGNFWTLLPAYTKCDVQLIKVAPDDGLIQSETCRASNGK